MHARSCAHRARLASCALTLALVPAALSGCAAERSLRISSIPTGAQVRLDGEVVGQTPYEEAFSHYGTRRVTLYLDGYANHTQRVKLRPPWYGRFPLDLITEILIPIGWKDRHEIAVELQPEIGTVSARDFEALLERAEVLRRATPKGPRFPEQEAEQEPQSGTESDTEEAPR